MVTRRSERMKLWAIRHGPVDAPGRCYGQTELASLVSPADAAAHLVARLLEQGLSRPAEVWSSPWSRARGVAEALAAHWAVPLHVDARLSELHFGAWENRLWSELERDDARLGPWMADWQHAQPPNGESWPQLQARIDAWLAELAPFDAERVMVGHAGPIRALRVRLEGKSPEAAFAEPVEHLVPYRLGL